MIDESVFDLLSTDSTIISLVSGRIYPLVLPQNYTVPAIVYQNTGIEKDSYFDNESGAYTETTFQIDAIASSYSDIKNISQAIFNALNNFKGNNSGNQIYNIKLESYLELYEDQLEAFRASRVILIKHED